LFTLLVNKGNSQCCQQSELGLPDQLTNFQQFVFQRDTAGCFQQAFTYGQVRLS